MIITHNKIYSGLPVIRPLTVNGDTTGTFNAIGNYSVTSQDFYYEVPAGSDFLFSQLTISLSTASGTFNQVDYGSIAGGITNGLKIFLRLAGNEIQILASQVIKTNADFYVLTFNVEKSIFAGTPQTLVAAFDLNKDYGAPLVLEAFDRIIVRCNDDFTSLSSHKFVARGLLA